MTSTPPSTEILWFARRDSVVRGPFPAAWIRRYILLGRIRLTDELRSDQGEWRPAFRCEELIPDVLRQPLTEDNLARLKRARQEADERGPGDRRARGRAPNEDLLGRRTGDERRRPEPRDILEHRARRARDCCLEQAPAPAASARPRRGLLLLGLLLGALLLVVLLEGKSG
jgi:hypothetical protein